MADHADDGSLAEPPYKKNLERLAALQDRLSKVQKTAESLLATVSGTGDYTDKVPPPVDSTVPEAYVCPTCSCVLDPFTESAMAGHSVLMRVV